MRLAFILSLFFLLSLPVLADTPSDAQLRHAVAKMAVDGPMSFAHAKAAAAKAGVSLSPASLQSPLPPPNDNAAPLYQQIIILRRKHPMVLPDYAEPLRPNFLYTPEQLDAVQKLIDEHQDVIALLDQATDRPTCVSVRDWSKGKRLLLPDFAPMQENAQLLATESYLLAHQGRWEDAVQMQARGFRLAEHVASDPTLLAYLVGDAIEDMTLRGLKDILIQAGPNQAVADSIAKVIQQDKTHLSLRHALSGELVFKLHLLSSFYDFDENTLKELLNKYKDVHGVMRWMPTELKARNAVLDAQQAYLITQMLQAIHIADQPRTQRETGFVEWSAASQPEYSIAMMWFPKNINEILKHAYWTDTETQVLLAAASVLSAHTAEGGYPDTLPNGTLDPLTGKPLGYRREGNGFVIYSVGPTGKYDGGILGEPLPHGEVRFRYPAPAPMPLPGATSKGKEQS